MQSKLSTCELLACPQTLLQFCLFLRITATWLIGSRVFEGHREHLRHYSVQADLAMLFKAVKAKIMYCFQIKKVVYATLFLH